MTTTAPDHTVWWDVTAVTGDALDILRLKSVDVDADRVAELVDPAGQRINDFLDRPDTNPITIPPPEPLVDAIVQVVVELYRRKDAPPSSVDGMMLAAWRPPSLDPIAAVRTTIMPYKRRWGVG